MPVAIYATNHWEVANKINNSAPLLIYTIENLIFKILSAYLNIFYVSVSMWVNKSRNNHNRHIIRGSHSYRIGALKRDLMFFWKWISIEAIYEKQVHTVCWTFEFNMGENIC